METKLFNRDFTLVVIGQIISLFGNGILRFALPLYLLRETGSPALFGIVTACSFVPMIALSFVGGILADRVNKRNIMVILDFLTGGIILLLLLCLNRLAIVPLFIVVLMLLYGIAGAYQPTVQASIPVLVAPEHVLSAGAIVNQIGALAGLLGPVVGGMLFGKFGILPILWISVGCFVFSAVMEIFICIPFEKRDHGMRVSEIVRRDIADSVGYIKRDKPVLLQVMGLCAALNLVLSAAMIVGIPVLIVDTLGLSDAQLGFTQGAYALGGLCGGITTAIAGKRLKLSSVHYLLLLSTLTVGVMALPLLLGAKPIISYLVLTVMGLVCMGLCTMVSVQLLATLQLQTPPALVGKVIALAISLSMCAQPLGQAIYGVIFDLFPANSGVILLVTAALSLLIALTSKKVMRAL